MGTKSKISPLSLLSLFLAMALSFSLTATDVSAEDAILNPAYITGTVSLGDMSGLHLNNGNGGVFKVKVWASGKDSSGKELYAETWLAEPLPDDGNLGNYTLTLHVPDGAASQQYDVFSKLCYTPEESLSGDF